MDTRNTLQRSLVLKAAHELNHPSADEIYRVISSTYPSVSRGTVYRNLSRLVEQGALCKVTLPDAADRFDDMTEAHYHVHCRICDRVDDATIPYQPVLTQNIADTGGYLIERHDIILNGICPDCLKKSVRGSGPEG